MSEKEIETQILTWLNYQQGVFAFKVNTVGVWDSKKGVYRKNWNRFIIAGTSDIICSIRGVFTSIEVKTPEALKKLMKNPTPAFRNQLNFTTKVNDTGGIGLIVSSLAEVQAAVREIFKQMQVTGSPMTDSKH